MGKVVDITDKLSFDENPMITIKGESFEVNADAKTMLQIMGFFSSDSEMEATIKAYEAIFSEKDRERLDKLKLPFKDLMVVIEAAMDLVQGDSEQGE